jgi:hypothetical protein
MDINRVKDIFTQYDIFDKYILEHGFTKNSRDYRIVFDFSLKQNNSEYYEFLFIGCVEFNYKNTLPEQKLYLEENQIENGERYFWTNFSIVYPGLEIIENSELTDKWEMKFKCKFHHIRITTNVFELEIIFNKIKANSLKAV